MRKMRLFKREVKEADKLRQIVEQCDVVRIGAVDEEGMFIVPVNFGYEMEEYAGTQSTENADTRNVGTRDVDVGNEEAEKKPKLRLYFHSAGKGRKAEAFAKNPRVAIEMDCGHELIRGDYACSYSCAFYSIMGNGSVHLVTDREEKVRGLTLLMEHIEAPEKIAFDEGMLERVNVYRIDVDTYTGKMRLQD